MFGRLDDAAFDVQIAAAAAAPRNDRRETFVTLQLCQEDIALAGLGTTG
jgi:hypothetical protein